MTTPLVPRPDQRQLLQVPAVPGSRSGSGELGGALIYPGLPSAVPNCQSASRLLEPVTSGQVFFTFPAPGRIWQVVLSYVITANNSFSLATIKTYSSIQTVISNLILAVAENGVAGPNQASQAQSEPSYSGLPVVQGESLTLIVNAGNSIAQLDQRASAVVLYSIP